MSESPEMRIQRLLAEVMERLHEVQKIVDENDKYDPFVMFMDRKFVPHVGLMDKNYDLALSSEWNSSDCSIEGYYAWDASDC